MGKSALRVEPITMRPVIEITLNYKSSRGEAKTLVLIQDGASLYRDSSGRVFHSLAMAKNVHRVANRITGMTRLTVMAE